MSFPLKLLLAIGVWLLFYLLTFNGCQDELCHACDEAPPETTETDTGPAPAPSYPLYFQWSDTTAYTNAGIDSLREAILAQGEEGQLLEITGFYYEDETPPDGYENLGLARAAQVARLFEGELEGNRLQPRARLVDETEGVRQQPFEGAAFEWTDSKTSATVDEIGDRILIRFPVGSTEKIYDESVEQYLNKLAERVKQTGERVELTGHTDNTGSDADNLELGQARADAIQRILTQKGVPAGQISTDTRGESQPVASNDTEEGRYENRRVEVRLIKQDSKTN
ncbi:MAG: OmpA family protein [Bacteroidetes bacterium]|jgi:outer membrane protein OmpA-like peptidoglycan-associated protein|nr:OmpA family protein [Bacteroidota bacterium]